MSYFASCPGTDAQRNFLSSLFMSFVGTDALEWNCKDGAIAEEPGAALRSGGAAQRRVNPVEKMCGKGCSNLLLAFCTGGTKVVH